MDKEVHSSRKAECEQNRTIHKIWEDPMAARDVGCTLGILLCSFFFGWGLREEDAGGKTQGHVAAQQML